MSDEEWDCPNCGHHNELDPTVLPYSDGETKDIECSCCGQKATVTGYVDWTFVYKVEINGQKYDVSSDDSCNDYGEAYKLLHPKEKEENE